MKFNKVSIRNFRSYYGRNNIYEFSTDPKKPITVIVGTNGGGKSSLMLAIQWCLFGDDIVGIEKGKYANESIRHQASSDDTIYSVELTFEHNGQSYVCERGMNDSNPFFIIKTIDEDGNRGAREENPQRLINSILPQHLKNWFFYNAEGTKGKKANTLDNTVRLDGGDDFKKALRQIQGFTKIDQLLRDLKKIEDLKKRQAEKASKNKEVSTYIEEIEKIESFLDKEVPVIQALKEQQDKLSKGEQGLMDQLIKLPDTKEITKTLQQAKKDLEKKESELKDALADRNKFYADSLPQFLLHRLFKNIELNQEKEGEVLVQAPHNVTLYEKIMSDGVCICGEKIEKNGQKAENLKRLMAKAKDDGTAIFNERVSKLNTEIRVIKDSCKKYAGSLSKNNQNVSSIESEIIELKERIRENQQKLDSMSGADSKIAIITGKLNQIKEQRDAVLRSLANKQSKQEAEANRKKRLVDEKNKVSGEQELSIKVNSLLLRVKKIIEYTEEKLLRDEKNSLQVIQVAFNNALEKFAAHNMEIKINPDTYEVKILEGNTIDANTKYLGGGNEELVKYFFVSCVLGLAKRETQKNLNFLQPPTSSPVILDAPFTKMGNDLIKGAVNVLMANIEQIIFIGLPDDFKKYEKEIKPFIGKGYLAIMADKSKRNDSKNKPTAIEILDKMRDFVLYDHKVEGKNVSRTVIEAII